MHVCNLAVQILYTLHLLYITTIRTYCIKELQFPWKYDSVGQLGVAIAVLHVLEPLQMKSQNLREVLHSESLSSFLFTATTLTVVLGVLGQGLGTGEPPENVCFKCVCVCMCVYMAHLRQ